MDIIHEAQSDLDRIECSLQAAEDKRSHVQDEIERIKRAETSHVQGLLKAYEHAVHILYTNIKFDTFGDPLPNLDMDALQDGIDSVNAVLAVFRTKSKAQDFEKLDREMNRLTKLVNNLSKRRDFLSQLVVSAGAYINYKSRDSGPKSEGLNHWASFDQIQELIKPI